MKNVRLILVEDDAFTRATLGDALAHQGFDAWDSLGFREQIGLIPKI